MATRNVNGRIINFDESAGYGVEHLSYLKYEEIEALFAKAVANGSAMFVHEGNGYKIAWSGGETYTMSKKY